MGNENLQNTLENIPTNATNTTANIGLPLFTADDKPSWLTDWNGAMSKIDENAGVNSESLELLKTATDSMSPKITNLENRADLIETEQAEHDADISKNTSDLATVKDDLISQNAIVKKLVATELKTLTTLTGAYEISFSAGVANISVNIPEELANIPKASKLIGVDLNFYRVGVTPTAVGTVSLYSYLSNPPFMGGVGSYYTGYDNILGGYIVATANNSRDGGIMCTFYSNNTENGRTISNVVCSLRAFYI